MCLVTVLTDYTFQCFYRFQWFHKFHYIVFSSRSVVNISGELRVKRLLVMVMVMVMVYFCHYTLKKYIIMYNVHRIKGKKWREGP